MECIVTTRSFDKDIDTFDELKRLTAFTSHAAEKLRAQNSLCHVMNLFVETNRFKETEIYYCKPIQLRLPFATSSTLEMVAFVMGLKHIYPPSLHYKKAGVTLSEFVDVDCVKPLFFNSDPKHKELMKVMDKINTTNPNFVRLAGMDKKTFKMRQEHLSPAYTANLRDVLKVKVG